MEQMNGFSTMQGGFRVGKTTYTKIWTLVNQIEDANKNNKPLHLCYIDVKKAYDSVEHWSIKKLLTQYKFHPDFIKLICNIYENNTCGFATPIGSPMQCLLLVGLGRAAHYPLCCLFYS